MARKYFNPYISKSRKLSILLAVTVVFTFAVPSGAVTGETPEETYTGIDNASVILNNINYSDVNNSDTWAKEAVYETGALGIMKGYGDRYFGLAAPISKEQAVAIAYRAAGREADAQKAAEALDNARQAGSKKKDAVSMWADGYLQLAANEGLITPQDLNDAFNANQGSLTPGTSFLRSAPAQRQDMAVWLAKTLGLQPVYGQDSIFNNYNDWKSADPVKIPYIEAVLKNNIMNGDGAGNFNPAGKVTREQAAQILKNAEKLILPIMTYEKKTGTVEDIINSVDLSQGESITANTIDIRNSDGKLHRINTRFAPDPDRNEQVGVPLPGNEKDFVVFKDGKTGKSSLLKKGDRIEYIVAPDKSVRFVKVISSVNDTKYIAAQINGIDSVNLTLDVTPLFKLDYPDMNTGNIGNLINNNNGLSNASYRYSNTVEVLAYGSKSSIDQLKPDMTVILTIKGDIVNTISLADIDLDGENGIVKGVVEENNPQLGYITLYGEDISGSKADAPNILRTFNYINQNGITVYKNHQKAKIEDVEAGDSVFIKLDDKLNVFEISAADNYTLKYGRIISKRPSSIAVEFENGTQQVLPVDSSIPVIKGNKVAGLGSLEDGDRIKLLLNISSKLVKVKEITIEDNQHLVKNLYKGKVAYADDVSNKLVMLNLERLDKGRWTRIGQVGVNEISLSEKCKIYSDNTLTDIAGLNRNLKNKDAYIASEEDYGRDEKAVIVSFRNEDAAEALIDDSVAGTETGVNEFGLAKYNQSVKYTDGTIIVKNSKIVDGNSIVQDDLAYVVANRDTDDGEYYAGIVQINERPDNNFVQIYRGRIKEINENKDFTVESYSQLKDMNWEYSNTPKTFNITYDTRISGDSGIIAQRDFIGYGDNSYTGRSVYILADNINALLISTAPFGPDGVHAKGRIYEITGGSTGENGEVLDEPTGIKLRDTKVYDTSSHIWTDSKDITLNILKNSIILKDDKIAKPSDLSENDTVKVYKKGNDESGDAYIITVEE